MLTKELHRALVCIDYVKLFEMEEEREGKKLVLDTKSRRKIESNQKIFV